MKRVGFTLIEPLVVIAIFALLTADSYHPGGVNTLMGDGSVRFIKNSVNGTTWRALGSISGGEVISADSY